MSLLITLSVTLGSLSWTNKAAVEIVSESCHNWGMSYTDVKYWGSKVDIFDSI